MHGSYRAFTRCATLAHIDDHSLRLGTHARTHTARAAVDGHSRAAMPSQLLVEFGADIAAKNDEGDTPLLEALMEKRFEVL